MAFDAAHQVSPYVAQSAELADIQSTIRADLRKVGRLNDHTPAAIVAASIVALNNPTTWSNPPEPRAPLRRDETELRARDLVLSAWASAQAEAADVTVWIGRLRGDAAEQLTRAEKADAEAAYRQGCADTHTARGWEASAADYASQADHQRRYAQTCRDRADDLTSQADTLERLGPPKPFGTLLASCFPMAAE